MTPEVARIVTIAAYSIGAVLLAVVLSFLVPWISLLLEELRGGVGRSARRVLQIADSFVQPRLKSFWGTRLREPHGPVAAELARAAVAIESMGEARVVELVEVEARLDRDLELLNALGVQPTGVNSIDASKISKGVRSSGAALLGLIGAIIFALMLGALNSFLLHLFFRDVFGSIRLIPYPGPNFQASHALAILFFSLEIIVGLLLHGGSKSQEESATSVIFQRVIPWGGLVVLAVVEVIAYSSLSVRVNMPDTLHVTRDSAFYDITLYFLAGFGGMITLLLAAMGYSIGAKFADYQAARAERTISKALGRYKDSVRATTQHVETLARRIESVKTLASTIPQGVVNSFRSAVGGSDAHLALAELVRQSTVAPLTHVDTLERGNAPVVRTRSQVLGDLLVSFLLLVGLVLLSWFATARIAEILRAGTGALSGEIGRFVGFILASAVVLLAMISKNALLGSRYTSLAAAAVPMPQYKRWLGWVMVGALVVAIGTFTSISGSLGLFSDNPSTSALLGLFLVCSIAALGAFLDQGLVAAWHMVYLLFLGITWIGARLYAALTFLIGLVTYAVRWLLRVLAVPGDVIRGFLNRKESVLPSTPAV
jgi:hypothetical protein